MTLNSLARGLAVVAITLTTTFPLIHAVPTEMGCKSVDMTTLDALRVPGENLVFFPGQGFGANATTEPCIYVDANAEGFATAEPRLYELYNKVSSPEYILERGISLPRRGELEARQSRAGCGQLCTPGLTNCLAPCYYCRYAYADCDPGGCISFYTCSVSP